MTIRAELDNMRGRVEGACAGPWAAEPDDTWWLEGVNHRVVRAPNDHEAAFSHDGDAEFIAHARTDLPRLLEAVEAVLAECAQMSTGSDTEAFCAERVRDAITTALEGK